MQSVRMCDGESRVNTRAVCIRRGCAIAARRTHNYAAVFT